MKKSLFFFPVLFLCFACSEKGEENPLPKNFISVNGVESLTSKAAIIEWETTRQSNDPWYDVAVFSEHITYSESENRFVGAGPAIFFAMNSDRNGVKSGEYILTPEWNEDPGYVEYSFYGLSASSEPYSGGNSIRVLSGKLNLSLNNQKGNIHFNGIDEEGNEIIVAFSGEIPVVKMYELED